MNFITKRIRQIFFMNKAPRRVVAALLAFCMVFSTMLSSGAVIASADDTTGNVNLSGFSATIDGKNLDDAGALKDGQQIRIEFTWTLDDSDRTSDTFIAQITPLQNIVLVNYPEAPLEVDGYGVVGTYSIQDNKFTIKLDKEGYGKEFYNDDGRNGWAHINGTIQVKDENAKDGDSVPYSIGSSTGGTISGFFEYDKDVAESTLGVSKSLQGSIEKNGDNYQQKYRVKVSASNGEVSGINLTDELGSGLSNLRGVTVVEAKGESFTVGSTYQDLNAPFSGVTLQKGEYVVLEYTVDIDASIYSPNADWSAYKNKISANYTNNLSEQESVQTGDVYVWVNRPSVSKSGTIPEGQDYVEWTITIRLNDLKDDATFEELVTSIIDTPGVGLDGQGNPVTLQPSDFVETSNDSGVYTYTYKTDIKEDYYNSVSKLDVKNEVKVTIGENDYTATGTAKTPGVTDIISKAVVENSFDETTGLLEWTVTIDTSKFPYDTDLSDGDDNVKNLTICDRASDVGGDITGNHTVNGAPNVQIWVDGTKVVEGGKIIDTATGNPSVDEYGNSKGNGIIESCTGYYTQDIRLNDEYLLSKVATDTPITVTFQSYVNDTDRSGKIYQNTAYAKYTDPVTDSEASTPTVSAQWEDTTVFKNAIEKTGAQVAGENTIAYTLKINTANIDNLTVDKNIVLEDVLPDNMAYDEGSFVLHDYYKDTWNYYQVQDWLYNQAAASPSIGSATAYTEGDDNKIKIVIPVTDALIRLGEYAKNNYSSDHYLHITYTTTIDDAKAFLSNGVVTAFKNEVSGTFDGASIGDASSTTVLTPQNVVRKSGIYDQTTCPNVVYSVEINPQALDLSDGSLTAVDQLGSALSFNLDSIKVYENVNGAWVELVNGYSYSRNLADNSITFTLPDSKWLKIEYTARVLLSYSSDPAKNGQLTEENAFNKFNLSGMQEGSGGVSTKTVSAVIEPAVGAEATTGSIKLWKYWGESGSAHPLDGCTFTVYETDYDAATSTYTKNDAVFKENIVVNENGEVTIYKLTKDKVYALVETEAKEGYKLNVTPYYFVIPSSDDAKAQFEDTNASIYTGSAPTLPFENEVDDAKGIIKLGKDVSGMSFDAAKTSIEFKITGPNYEKVITGDQLTEYGNVITIADLEPGEYTIEETKKDVTGYNCKTTTYKVNTENAVTGTKTSAFEVKQNETTNVTFYNTYEQIKGSLKITKTVTGTPSAPGFTAVQNNLGFTITGPNGYSRVVAGSELSADDHSLTINDLVPGTYKIVETVGLVPGYSRVETENVVTVPGQTEVTTGGITADNVGVVSGDVTTVHYTNDYEADKGSIKLRKNTSGLSFDLVKSNIEFTITKPDGSTMTVNGSELVEPGNSLEIGGLEPGTYKIVETATAPTGYKLYTTTYSVSTVDGGATKTGTDTGDFELTSGNIIEVTFDNAYEHSRGSLKISKTVTGAGLKFDDVDDSLTFVINGPGYHKEISGTQLTLTGNAYVIDNLTPGTYTIAEKNSAVEGYSLVKVENVVADVTTEGTDAKFVISSDVTTEVAYTNTYEYGKGSIRLSKNSSGADFSDIKDTLSYTITGPNNYNKVIAGSDLTEADNSITIAGLEPGQYTITETRHDSNDKYEYKETVFSVNGGTNQQGDSASNVTLEAGSILDVAFTNTYSLILGQMKLTKNVAMSGSGSIALDDVRSSLTFRITGPHNYNKTFSGADLTEEGNSLLLTNLVPGTYIITEVTTDVSDYNLIKTEYVTGSTSVTGKIATVWVTPSKTADEVTLIDFNNLYEKKKGSLKLAKTVTGDADFDDVKEKISFLITGPGGYSRTVQGSELVQDGNSLTIKGLEIGNYTIVESADDAEGYTYVSTVNSADGGQKTAAVVVAADATAAVTFTNEYATATPDKGTLVITKTIKGDVTEEEAKGALVFTVTNVASGASTEYTLSQFDYDSTEDKYTLTLEKAPGGYTVEETVSTIDGYKVTVKSAVGGAALTEGDSVTATVEKDTTTTVDFEDEYTKVVGSLKLTKAVSGGVALDDAKEKISFAITGPGGYSRTVKGIELTEDGGSSLTITDLAIGEYTIVETAEDTDDYSYVSTVNSADNGKTTAKVSVATDATSDVTFTNTYKQKPGTLVITKTIKGDVTKEELQGLLTFEVKNNATGDSETYTLSQFTYDEGTDKYTLELPVAPGGYTVEEKTYTVDGCAVTVKYAVNGGAQTEDAKADVTVNTGATTTVDFENDYRKLKGNLYIEKSVTLGGVVSDTAFAAVKEKMSFVITGPNGYSRTVKGTELDPVTQTIKIEGLVPGDYTITEMVEGVPGYVYVATTNSVGPGSTQVTVPVEDYVSTGRETGMTFINDYTEVEIGKILIQKTLKGDITEEEAKGALKFKVTNTDTDEEKIYTLKDFTKQADGTYVLELDANVGGYTIEETVYDVDGYVTDSVKYSVDGSPMTDGTKADITVSKDTTTAVAFEDAYTKDEGKLVITKTIKGDVTKEEAEGALQFKVTDTGTGESEIYTLKDFTYDAATGVYTLELDVPSGTYTVEETIYDIKGYITASVKRKVGTGEYAAGTSADATVEIGKSINVDFEDTYEKNEGKLVLTKSVKGDLAWDDIKDDLSFVVKNVATGESKTYKASAFKDNDGDGVYTLVIDGLTRGEYTVAEKLGDVKGYMLETVYTVDGGSKTYGSKAKVTLGKEGVQVDFVNTYTSTKGKLVITKTLKGTIDRKDAEAVLEFKVTNTKTNKSKTYTLDDFTYDKETEKYTLELSLEPGTYKVTETVYDVDGYKLKSVTYQVGDGEREEGNSAKAKVETGETIKVAFIDKYYKTKTSDNSITQTPPTSTTTSTPTDRDTPKTGDESPLALWFMMLLFGGCGIVGSIYGLRKNKK